MSLTSEKGIAAKMLLLCYFACWHMSLSGRIWFLFLRKTTRFYLQLKPGCLKQELMFLLTCSALLGLEHCVTDSQTSQECCSFVSASALWGVLKPGNVQSSSVKKGVDTVPLPFLFFSLQEQAKLVPHPFFIVFCRFSCFWNGSTH